MDTAIIDAINARVGRDDTLYHLGDFAWKASKYGHYRNRLNVRKLHIIKGNHDSSSIRPICSSLNELLSIKIRYRDNEPRIKIQLCHYPMLSWDALHYGGVHLYGHSHGTYEAQLDALFPGRRAMDVGVDNIHKLFGRWGPVSLPEVLSYLGVTSGESVKVAGPFRESEDDTC